MKIEVETVKENDDGSCDVLIKTDKEGTEGLVEYAILDIFRKAAEAEQRRKNNPYQHIDDLPEALF